jgi:hypothetical protein
MGHPKNSLFFIYNDLMIQLNSFRVFVLGCVIVATVWFRSEIPKSVVKRAPARSNLISFPVSEPCIFHVARPDGNGVVAYCGTTLVSITKDGKVEWQVQAPFTVAGVVHLHPFANGDIFLAQSAQVKIFDLKGVKKAEYEVATKSVYSTVVGVDEQRVGLITAAEPFQIVRFKVDKGEVLSAVPVAREHSLVKIYQTSDKFVSQTYAALDQVDGVGIWDSLTAKPIQIVAKDKVVPAGPDFLREWQSEYTTNTFNGVVNRIMTSVNFAAGAISKFNWTNTLPFSQLPENVRQQFMDGNNLDLMRPVIDKNADLVYSGFNNMKCKAVNVPCDGNGYLIFRYSTKRNTMDIVMYETRIGPILKELTILPDGTVSVIYTETIDTVISNTANHYYVNLRDVSKPTDVRQLPNPSVASKEIAGRSCFWIFLLSILVMW